MLTLLLALLSHAFITGPLQTELDNRLGKAGVPPEVMSQLKSCVNRGVPAFVDRMSSQPGWAIGIALDIWLKRTQPELIVDQAAPNCRPAVDAARRYL
ncbi:hypothetical protein DNX69_06675 [Rhodopseudomonas palustris]|uniref:Uncharacterized protein n=1 Tax=Rhodopseudomonas palustris TaxID=1076 RepID=A0A323UKV6_RHOPL|nr:hypothetical protein DNX69_06675 [Rhodopseudomonas palustris]